MASLQGLPSPTIDWTDRSIDAAFENFRETCTLIFDGPLADVADKIKVNYLKLWAGEEGRRIIKTWQMTDDESKKLDTYWGKFKDYVKPKSNFRIARYKLRECKQTDSEPVDVFVKRLRTILAECKYPKEQQEVHLLDAMIFGIKLEKVQSQLLQHDETLTVDQALMLARTEEATRQQIEEPRGITKPVDVIRKPAGHAGKTRPRQRPQAKTAPQEKLPQRVSPNKGQPTCGNCGREQHAKSENCPARGSRCSNCQKLGHWSNVCRSKPRESRRKYPQSQRYDRKSQHIDNVDVDHFEDAVQIAEQQDEYFMYTVTIDSVSSKSQALADLKIISDVCSRIVTCKLDTGAEANIIPYNTLNTLVLDASTRLKPSTIDGVEIVCIEVKLLNKKIIIACIYRPPGNRQQVDEFLENFQFVVNMRLNVSAESIVIVGDFNDRCISWNDSHCNSELGTRFKELIEGNIMFQLISEPTHITPNLQTVLDLIITDSPGYILDSGVGHPIGDPYHCYVFCKLAIRYCKDKKYQRTFWDFKDADFDTLNDRLKSVPWDTMFIFDEVNDMADHFLELFKTECQSVIQQKTVTIKPWMTKEIKHKLSIRDRYFRRWKASGSDQSLLLYRSKRNEANVAMAVAKAVHFDRIKNKLSNPNVGDKEYWHLIKSIYGCKIDSGMPSIIDNDVVYATAADKAKLFNDHFLEKSRLPVDLPELPPRIAFDEASIYTLHITEEEVEKVLLSLNVQKATGCDHIGNMLLKSCATTVSAPLAKLFQTSINKGQFPDSWKLANVTPVFKKGDKQVKNNYRPISILPNIGKVFERVVFIQLYKYFQEHNC